mgnify:CR=1 FL=1
MRPVTKEPWAEAQNEDMEWRMDFGSRAELGLATPTPIRLLRYVNPMFSDVLRHRPNASAHHFQHAYQHADGGAYYASSSATATDEGAAHAVVAQVE